MKKTLKFALVIFIIIALLSGNTTVLAKEIIDEVTSEQNAISEKKAEQETETVTPSTEKTEENAQLKEDIAKEETKNTTDKADDTNTTESKKADEVSTTNTTNTTNATSTSNTTNTTNTSEAQKAVGANPIKIEETKAPEIKIIDAPSATNELDTSKLKGKINLSIDLRLPQTKVSASDLTISLKKSGIYDEGTPLKANGTEKEKQLFYTFDNLDAGTYTLTMQGTGYQTVSQANVEVKANTTTELHFTNGYDGLAVSDTSGDSMLGDGETTKKGRTGVIGIGDVNKDGKITADDVTAIVNNIEGKTNTEPGHNIYDYVYDLNKDGVVDIGDISYAALNKGHSFIGATSRFLTNIDTSKVQTKAEKGKVSKSSTGTIKDILENNDKHVTLEPANTKQPISNTNPISVEIDIAEDTAETQLLSIAPSSNVENNITEGTIIVDGHNNETGEDVKIECKIGNEQKAATVGFNELYKIAEVPTVISDSQSTKIATISGTAKIENDGTIVVDFGNAIAVKRVIINVTGTTSNKLADISKVEFLNGMEDKIPEPDLNVPELRKEDIDKSITEESFMVKWNNEPNVTGYQVSITANLEGTEYTEVHDVDGHQLQIEQFHGDFIKNHLQKDPTSEDYTVYYVKVRSVNGEWFSPYSEAYPVKPRPTSKPNAPTGVKLVGAYQQIKVTWNADPRATSYIVEYKPTNSNEEFKAAHEVKTQYNTLTKVEETIGIKETSFTITGLASEVTEYSVRVIACNSLGKSEPSQIATAKTLAVQEVELPTYKKINTSKGPGVLSSHIKDITFKQTSNRMMIDSPLDIVNGQTIGGSAKGVADNDFSSHFYVGDWDLGGYYMGSDKGLVVEFDKPYKMNYVTLAKVQWNGDFAYSRVWYYDCEEGKTKGQLLRVDASQVVTRKDKDGHKYTSVKLQKPIYTNKMVVSIGNYSGDITIAEMGFYEYDNIEERINALFKDAMHLELADDISTEDARKAVEAKIKALEDELNAGIEKQGGEAGEKDYHPDKDALLEELNSARLLLQNTSLGKITKINSRVTSFYDSHIEFSSGLNGFQPLGVAARAGEDITVYVGNPYKNVGDSTSLQLIATQWRAEGDFQKVIIQNLKVGINKITIPEMISTSREKGGSLYINYTGLKDDYPYRYIDRNYAVRVIGGEELPVLDLSSKEDVVTGNKIEMTEQEKKDAVLKYIKEIEPIVNSLEEKHKTECKEYKGADEYGVQDCLLGLTEIVLDQMMYSVSSKQIYDGLTEKIGGTPTIEQRANALYDSLTAMDDMMDLFYSQKGLVKEGNAPDAYPRTRQNIRCMRMTGRAFMYAGGAHIGIQWNEVKDLAKGVPMKVDSEGKETADSQGNYFGWGIAHEIGHVINQKAYVHGEVTNNYFSILAQTDNTRKTVRFNYEDVYDKVTSGKIGKAQNVFTQLGLYWQLHLAYDHGGYNYKEFATQQAQLDNSIYARIDSYARDTSRAPVPTHNKGVALVIDSDSDNNLMRLACAATKKNVLEFFEKWGMVPNDETKKYAEQWDKEERAIWYVNDEARNYVLEGNLPLTGTTLEASITNAENSRVSDNKVNFSLNISGKNVNGLLGYEIIRSYKSNDQIISRSVAFVEPTVNEDGTVNANVTYTDTIDTINNRAFTYTIVAYDKYLNEIARKELEQVKVSHQGEISQKGWEVTTNMTSEDDTYTSDKNGNVETSDFEQKVSAVPTIADGKLDTVFNGKVESGKSEITISLPEIKKLVGLKYSGKKIDYYEIQVSSDGVNWTTVKKVEKPGVIARIFTSIGNFFTSIANTDNSQVIDFTQIVDGVEKIYNYDYDCSYVKLIIDDTSVSINEINLLAQSGDNVEFNETGSIGVLASSFEYDKTAHYSIPENSIIFTGTYKGNPAYNVTKLWYEDEKTGGWKMLNGYQIILAPDPGAANLGETSDGKWIYVVEEKEIGLDGKPVKDENGKEKANEDYKRIKDALGKGKVRVELYRVDNALTNEGERLVSDTLVTTIPSTLDSITLTSDSSNQ